MAARKRPNILITGTPGTGKTALASLIGDELEEAVHLNTADIIREHHCYEGRDEVLDSNILDEDKLLDVLEALLEENCDKTIALDFHICEIFPERWFDLVLVLRTNTEQLFDRLTERGYNDKKREENMECEIMQVVLEEARENYDENIVHEVASNSIQDMEDNLNRVRDWTAQWLKDQANLDEEIEERETEEVEEEE